MKRRYQPMEKYLSYFPGEMQEALQEMRMLVNWSSSVMLEQVSNGVITYFFHGIVVQFDAEGDSIRFAVSPATIRQFQKELTGYVTEERGVVYFPIGNPLPAPLIRAMVRYRVDENCKRRESEIFGKNLPWR